MRKAPGRSGCLSRLNRYIMYILAWASGPPVNYGKFMLSLPPTLNFEP